MHLARYRKDNAVRYGHLEGEVVGRVPGGICGGYARRAGGAAG